MIKIFEKTATSFSGMGLAVLQPISAVVEEEINGAYTLTLEMPKDDPWCTQERIITAPTPKNGFQAFRIYCPVVDLQKFKVVYARHIFYDLLDNFIETATVNGNGATALNAILSATQYAHNFTGTSSISGTVSAAWEMVNPVSALLDGDESVVQLWEGELERNNYQITMPAALGADRGVEIRYRKNLTGLNVKTDISNVVTRIMPTGVKADNSVLKIDAKYVNSPLISSYAHPKVKRIHYPDVKVTETRTEAQCKAALELLCQFEFLAGCDLPKITATVEFIPLQDTEEYKALSVLETVYLGDTVKVKHEGYGVDLYGRVISYEYNALTQKYNKVVIGSAAPTLGQSFSSQLNQIGSEVESTKSELETAIENATTLINNALGGYVVKKQGEILIMDTEDEMTATKVWRWNLNGLGYSSTGVNGPYATAITMNGAIVANFITTGTLSANLIRAGRITSQDNKSYFDLDTGALVADNATMRGKFIAKNTKTQVTIEDFYESYVIPTLTMEIWGQGLIYRALNAQGQPIGNILDDNNRPLASLITGIYGFTDSEGYSEYALEGLTLLGDMSIDGELSTSNGTVRGEHGIQCGRVTITPSAANTPTYASVYFFPSFAEPPLVIASPLTAAPGTQVTGVGIADITVSGCKIYLTRTNTTTTGIHWIAIERGFFSDIITSGVTNE